MLENNQALVTLLIFCAAVVGYGVLRYRFIQASQDFRIGAAIEADELMDEAFLPVLAKQKLQFMVLRAYSPAQPWRFVSALIQAPPVVLYRVVRGHKSQESSIEFPTLEMKSRYEAVMYKFVLAIILTSPAAIVAALFFGALNILVVASFGGIRVALDKASQPKTAKGKTDRQPAF